MFDSCLVKYVDSLEDLVAEKDWESLQLAVCRRQLSGDFNGLARVLATSDLSRDASNQVSIGNSSFISGQDTFEEAYERVKGALTHAQILAFQTILSDAEVIKHFEPQLDVEIEDVKNRNTLWHWDNGFEQGRFLCTYTTLATRFNIGGQEIDSELGDLTRHAVRNSQWKVTPLKHKRPLEAGASIKTPRLSLKSMAPEFSL